MIIPELSSENQVTKIHVIKARNMVMTLPNNAWYIFKFPIPTFHILTVPSPQVGEALRSVKVKSSMPNACKLWLLVRYSWLSETEKSDWQFNVKVMVKPRRKWVPFDNSQTHRTVQEPMHLCLLTSLGRSFNFSDNHKAFYDLCCRHLNQLFLDYFIKPTKSYKRLHPQNVDTIRKSEQGGWSLVRFMGKDWIIPQGTASRSKLNHHFNNS